MHRVEPPTSAHTTTRAHAPVMASTELGFSYAQISTSTPAGDLCRPETGTTPKMLLIP